MSELFAFRVGKPLDEPEAVTGVYDPVSQASTWEDGTPITAVFCAFRLWGRQYCNAYGSYCNVWGHTGNQACGT
jgi:hypothetical protein